MFGVLRGTVVCARVVKGRFCGWLKRIWEVGLEKSGRGRLHVKDVKEKVWTICGCIQQSKTVERSVSQMQRMKEDRICEAGVDNAFRFLNLGLGACAWLPQYALECTPYY